MQRLYKSAPLPFVGQKRKFVKKYKEILQSVPKGATIVDLFGGSGLLSHVTKRMRPDCHVVYNDFDDYKRRLDNVLTTNRLLSKIRSLLVNVPRLKTIPKDIKDEICNLIEQEEQQGQYVDYITLSSSLLFAMRYALSLDELRNSTMYNCIKRTDYIVEGYLEGLEIVSMDYRKLYDQYNDMPNVVFLVDPPYLSTDCSTYTMRWTMADYLDVLNVLAGHRFVYFTSNKSNILELCEWLSRNPSLGNPFEHCTKVECNTTVNYAAGYTDIMLYR